MENAFFAWSGGKDAALALYRVLQQPQYQVKYLLTTVNEAHQRVSMHGVRLALLEQQARAIGVPLKIVWLPENPTMTDYNARMKEALLSLKEEHITTGIYGDIFLADLRRYRENDLAEIGLKTAFPLWGENTKALVQEFLAAGFKARLVCVSDQQLGESFAGQPLTEALIRTFPAGVDPGGENGEYHSFVYAGPIFSQPVPYETGEIILRDYTPATKRDSDGLSNQPVAYDTRFWFCDLVPVTK